MLIIGHRGAAGLKPENTLSSFKTAIGLGVDMIEFDIQVCKSGEIVIIHDETVNRTTNGKGFVAEINLDELRLHDAGDGQKIPTLEETLIIIDAKAKLNIEIKSKHIAEKLSGIIQESIKEGKWQIGDFVVSSFDHKELLTFHNLLPEIKIGVLFEELPDNFNEIASKMKAGFINTDFRFLNKHMVDEIHQKGYKLMAYTVNTERDKRKMKTIGVDGIFTDFP